MKKLFMAALLLAGTAIAHPALDERWTMPLNGTVMMKVQMPPKEFEAMVAAMHAGNGCMIQEIYPDAHNTMILVCK